ncbi:glycosyltransferase [Rhizobium sp. KVB221]|uniref:Glycosyltransferase n=1 Tax=Rhizobium setariae TaxID=2801340 RepID=A0A936YTH7_9HYPH|nr:glycosyltransferase [Rhizobium setariae]MBL0372477.1 glycosyltransferase [Rhizobium setariae]
MRQGEYFQSGGEVSSLVVGSDPQRFPAFWDGAPQAEVDSERAFLKKLGFSKPFLEILAKRATSNGTSLEAELLADGRVREDAYYGALARVLELPFLPDIDPATIADRPGVDTQLLLPRMVRCHLPDRAPAIAIVPSAREIANGEAQICCMLGIRQRVVVTTPSAIRSAVWRVGAIRRGKQASEALFDARPDLSARIVISGQQGFVAGLCLTPIALSFFLLPSASLLVMHMLLSLCYFLALWIRGLASVLGEILTKQRPLRDPGELPVYTVLVALYQEQEVVAQLVDRLNKLNWPRSRLDIKLVCEERDNDTIQALRNLELKPEYEIVTVPDVGPRTKPKALNYALEAARGDYVVIYDAEDRPHPDQLLEAFQRFQLRPDDVACLQAPLIVSNAQEGWLSALFALEYAGLFRRILPLLGDLRQPMPLGGTSNHFRIGPLRSAGGWDPFNVTEDADLGLRFHRLGYRAEMIRRPTLEDAPTDKRVWLAQRSRWMKGWMQTWLVLMRQPRKLSGELGPAGTLVFHVMITGMLLSALGHPLIVGFVALAIWRLLNIGFSTPLEQMLLALDSFNTFGSYVLFVAMGYKAMSMDERRRVGDKWRYVPLYWLLISLAAWRALIELYTNPFLWRKTPHRPAVRMAKTAETDAVEGSSLQSTR